MLRQTVVLQRRTAKLFNDASKALHKRIHIFRLCLIHPHYVRCCFMAPIRPFASCRAQVPCVHKSFKTVSQLLENPYLYFCLANAGSPSQFACYPKAVRTGAPPKIKHRTPPPCVRPGSPPGLKFSLRPARPNGPFPFPGDETKTALCNERSTARDAGVCHASTAATLTDGRQGAGRAAGPSKSAGHRGDFPLVLW